MATKKIGRCMFGLFKSKQQKAIDTFWESEIGRRLTTHNEQFFGPGAIWGKLQRQGKQKICGWLSSAYSACTRRQIRSPKCG